MRCATITRTTKETSVEVSIDLNGTGSATVTTGIPFLDHLLDQLARYANLDLVVTATGDLAVDDHHTVEDVAIVLGECLNAALGDRAGITRFAHAYAPLDEALSRAVVDVSNRPGSVVTMPFTRESIGGLSLENLSHFFATLATNARITLHLDVLRGENDHHKAESAMKAFALALGTAMAITGTTVRSTKGVL